MRKIKIEKWKEEVPNAEGKTEKIEWSLLKSITMLINNKKPEEMPKGMDKSRMFNRIIKAFDKAEETKVLELEETDYTFIKDTIEKDIPANWGMNQSIMKAVEEFLNVKAEE